MTFFSSAFQYMKGWNSVVISCCFVVFIPGLSIQSLHAYYYCGNSEVFASVCAFLSQWRNGTTVFFWSLLPLHQNTAWRLTKFVSSFRLEFAWNWDLVHFVCVHVWMFMSDTKDCWLSREVLIVVQPQPQIQPVFFVFMQIFAKDIYFLFCLSFIVNNIPISNLCLFLMGHWLQFIFAHSSLPSAVVSVHMYLYILFLSPCVGKYVCCIVRPMVYIQLFKKKNN